MSKQDRAVAQIRLMMQNIDDLVVSVQAQLDDLDNSLYSFDVKEAFDDLYNAVGDFNAILDSDE